MMYENVLLEIEKKEKEMREKFKDKLEDRKKLFRSDKDIQQNVSNIYYELYSKEVEVFKKESELGMKIWRDIYPQYYRKLSADLAIYPMKDCSPVLAIIPPPKQGFSIKVRFGEYYGMTINDFFERVRKGVIFPLILDPSKYNRKDYIDFLKEFEKKFGFYPPYANRLPEILGFQELKNKWKEKLVVEFGKSRGNIRLAIEEELLKKVEYCPSLDPEKPINYLPERWAWLELIEGDFLCEKVLKIATEDVKKAMYYTFSLHQCFSAWFFYSKGGWNIFAPQDIERAITATGDLIKRFEKEIKEIEVASALLNFFEFFNILRKNFNIPVGKTPKDSEQIYRKVQKSEIVEEKLKTITEQENDISREIPKFVSKYSETERDVLYKKMQELNEHLRELGELYVDLFKKDKKLAIALIHFGADALHLAMHPDLLLMLISQVAGYTIEKITEKIAGWFGNRKIRNKLISRLVVPAQIFYVDREGKVKVVKCPGLSLF